MRLSVPVWKTSHLSLCVASAVLAVLCVPSAGFANPILTTRVTGNGAGATDINIVGLDSAGFIQPYSFAITPTDTVQGTLAAHARAAVGSLGVDAYALVDHTNAPLGSIGWDVLSTGVARFTDTLTITAAGLAGTPGSFTTGVNISGVYSMDSSVHRPLDYAALSYVYELVILSSSSQYDQSDETCVGQVPREFACDDIATLTTGFFDSTALQFTYGVPFTLTGSFFLKARAIEDGGDYGFASIAMMNSADLQGITSVKDGAGNTVTSFSVVADSGFDYTHPFGGPGPTPVPEPTTVSLLGLGLVGGLCRWRQRRRTTA